MCMDISASTVKEVRTRTSAGVLDCKKALVDCSGDIDGAVAALRKKGLAKAAKRAERTVGEGVIATYVHHNGRIGALVELNCETDFVARTDDFQKLAYDIALQVVGLTPLYLTEDERPVDCEASVAEACLLAQPFVKDPSKRVCDLITEAIARTGENIKVGRFARFELGC